MALRSCRHLKFFILDLFTSLEIDSKGYPHIVYAKDLWSYAPSLYVHKTDTGWENEDVSRFGGVQSSSLHHIALDSLDHPHIIFTSYGVFGRYAYFDGENWHYNDLPPPPLDTLPIEFGTGAITIDKNGVSHVVIGSYWSNWEDTLPGYVIYCHGTPTGVKEEKSPVKFSGTSLKITPNPSKGPFSIDLTNNEETTLRLKILDIQGRKVKSLGSIKRKGRKNIIWDARDDRGKEVPKGVYFLMIKGTRKTIVKRLVLIK